MDPRTNLPFYVGKGKEGTNRHQVHLYETEDATVNKHKFYKIRYLITEGYDIPVEIVKNNMSEEDAYALETDLIVQYGRENIDVGGILTNICLEAHPPSMLGRTRNREGIERYRQTRKGKCYLSKETKQQISAKLTGRKQSDETKAKRKQSLANNKNAYGRKRWLFVSPDSATYLLQHMTRNEFCAEFGLSVSRSFFAFLNTGRPVVARSGAKNTGWMFWDDDVLIEKYITNNNITPIIK